MRCYAPVVVRGEEERGVRLWSFGKKIYETLLNYILDEDYGDITDPHDGRDVKIVCTKNPGQMWATTEVRPRGKSTPLSENSSKSKGWLDNIPDVNDLYELKSYEELERIINDWLNEDEEDDSNKQTTRGGSYQKSSNKSNSDSPDAISGKYESLDAAFADLDSLD